MTPSCKLPIAAIISTGNSEFYLGDDLEKDMAAIGSDPVTRDWWKVCEPCQDSLDWTGPPPSEGGKGGNWWAPIEEVFHDGHPATQYK